MIINFYQNFATAGLYWDKQTEERFNSPLFLEQYGYKVYSQNDEDGIITEIFRRIGTTDKRFIEFGVQDGLENNTHYLLFSEWTGLWIEGDENYYQSIQDKFYSVIKTSQLKTINCFITRDNVNNIFVENNFIGQIDLLSIDIDGNDYHIFEAIDVINPRVIVIEYNAKFPPECDWEMPYEPDYTWNGTDKHGASLKALEKLAQQKGYKLVATNINGVNAFFVRSDLWTADLFPSPAVAELLYNPFRSGIQFVSGHPAKVCLLNSAEGMTRRYYNETPFTIMGLELTNHCMMHCITCPRTYAMNRETGYMSMELFRKIIDEYVVASPSVGVEYGTGSIWLHLFGESLLSPIFDEAVSYASQKGLKPMLSINPIALNREKMNRLLNAKPYLLYLMIDGCDENSFSYVRGVEGKYNKSVENALEFLELKNKLGSDVRIFIVSIDIPGRENIIDETHAFWENREGVEGFLRKPFCNWNGSVHEITSLAEEMPSELCSFPWQYIAITWDGIVVPCCYDFDKMYPLGDVNKESLTDIWNGEKLCKLREEFVNGNITNKLCRTCYQGGKAKNVIFTQDKIPFTSDLRVIISAKVNELHTTTDKELIIPVVIDNQSPHSISSKPPFPVHISYHIKNDKNEMVIFDGRRTSLDYPLNSGQQLEVDLSIDIPNTKGNYVLEITMVQEEVSWWDDYLDVLKINLNIG